MERSVGETVATRNANYLAQAADADKKAARSTDEAARKAWLHIADGYRDLAANLVRNVKP